jgi:GNAT superfamily N-acetyltransferase
MTGNAITVETMAGEMVRDTGAMREILAYLVREEALHCIQIASALAESPHGATTFHVARSGNAIVGVGSITAGFNMLLSRLGDDVASAFVNAVHGAELPIPGVIGNERDALEFATAWQARTGARIVPGMRQAVMACHSVRPPRAVPGTWSRAIPSDREWLLPWLQAFADEADPGPTPNPDAGEAILGSVQPPGGMFVWRDESGQPVSIAGYKGQTVNGIRIGPVYTLPQYRGRGYGSAITALATKALLDEGRQFICLYTDLANPTANHIYAEIGYEPVATSIVLRFT